MCTIVLHTHIDDQLAINYWPCLFYLEKAKYGNQNIKNSAKITPYVAESLNRVSAFLLSGIVMIEVTYLKQGAKANYMGRSAE